MVTIGHREVQRGGDSPAGNAAAFGLGLGTANRFPLRGPMTYLTLEIRDEGPGLSQVSASAGSLEYASPYVSLYVPVVYLSLH